MPSSVPPVLSPYVTPAPQGSLALVTSVLDAASNWLLLRYVQAALKDNVADKTHGSGDVLASDIGNHLQENFKVIFVSVLRGFEQWREMGKKVVCDLISSSLLKSILPSLHFISPFWNSNSSNNA
jgi:elongator complex protein 6